MLGDPRGLIPSLSPHLVAGSHRRGVQALGEAKRPGDERWHSRRIRVSRVHHHYVRLGQNLRAHRGDQGPALLQPASDESAARLLALLIRDAFGTGSDLGPAEYVIVGSLGRIAR